MASLKPVDPLLVVFVVVPLVLFVLLVMELFPDVVIQVPALRVRFVLHVMH